MTALPRRMYRDPAVQLLEKEAESCKGCRWVDGARSTQGQFDEIARCKNQMVAQVLADKRCDEYQEPM